jgi:hypothetical protein
LLTIQTLYECGTKEPLGLALNIERHLDIFLKSRVTSDRCCFSYLFIDFKCVR